MQTHKGVKIQIWIQILICNQEWMMSCNANANTSSAQEITCAKIQTKKLKTQTWTKRYKCTNKRQHIGHIDIYSIIPSPIIINYSKYKYVFTSILWYKYKHVLVQIQAYYCTNTSIFWYKYKHIIVQIHAHTSVLWYKYKCVLWFANVDYHSDEPLQLLAGSA